MATRAHEPNPQVLAKAAYGVVAGDQPAQGERGPQIARRRYSMDAAKLFAEYERRESQLSNWRSQCQLLADYLEPNRTPFTTMQVAGQIKGEKRTQKLFDSTAPHAVSIFAANIHGAVASPAQKFFSLQARNRQINAARGVRQYLEEIADRTYLGFSNSNFITEHAEFFIDLTVFCTAAIMLEEADRKAPGQFGGFRFKALPLGTFVWDEDADGRVNLVDRKVVMSAGACAARWKDQAGERILTLAREKPEEDVELIHAIRPRTDYDRKKLDKLNMPFGSCWYTVLDKHKLGEGGYHEFPVFVTRWSKSAGEKFGRGPSWIAIPDILTLNRHIELYLQAGAKAVDPPLVELYDSIMGPVSLEPAALNTVKEKGALEALDSKTRWDIAESLSERLDRKIQALYYVDLIDSPEVKSQTATEAQIRNERTLRLLGPAGGRLHFEWLMRMIERSVALQYRAGALEDPPDELQTPDSDIDVIAEGALARAQRAGDLAAIERSYTLVAGIVKETGDMSMWDNYINDETAKETALITGMPANILRDEKDRDAMRAARAQAQQAQAKLAAIGQGAESLGKAAPGLKVLAEHAGPSGAGGGLPTAAAEAAPVAP